MKYYFFLLSLFLSCTHKINDNKGSESVSRKLSISEAEKETIEDSVEIIKSDEILFNNLHSREFSNEQFLKYYGQFDSINQVNWDNECNSYFEGDSISFIYKNKTKIEKYYQNLAIEIFSFSNGNYIYYNNIRFDSTTSIPTLSKYFPNATRKVTKFRSKNFFDEELSMIYLREVIKIKGKEIESDGRVILYFEREKLKYLEFWFPC